MDRYAIIYRNRPDSKGVDVYLEEIGVRPFQVENVEVRFFDPITTPDVDSARLMTLEEAIDTSYNVSFSDTAHLVAQVVKVTERLAETSRKVVGAL